MMDDQMTAMIDIGKQALERTVRDGDQFLPELLVEAGDGTLIVVALAGGHPFDVLAAALPMLQDMRPVKVSFTVDSYMIRGDLDDVGRMEAVRRRYGGSLQAAFEAGEESVSETLMFQVVTPTESDVIAVPYKRRNMGDLVPVEWNDPIEQGVADGRMVDVLRAVFV